jgi:hypothetical protein
MALTLAELRDNLDGLGYSFGPRGVFGVGNKNQVCDKAVLGNIDCSTTSVRDISSVDPYTRSAIYQFQVDNNLAATGNDGADLRAKVEEAVKIVQNNLKIVTGVALPITGKYLLQTIEAMKVFQRNRGLPVTGIATRPIRRILDNDARQIVGKPPTPTPTPTPDQPGSELDALRKLKADLSSLKSLHQQRTLSDSAFIDAVYKLIP